MQIEGNAIDAFTAYERLLREGRQGFSQSDLCAMTLESFSYNVLGDLEELQRRWLKRRVVGVATSMYAGISEGKTPEDVAAKAQESLSDILRPSEDTLHPLWSVLQEVYNEARSGNPPEVIPTGLGLLDIALGGGLPRKTLTIIGGRPSMGKSALATQIALHASRRHKKVLLFSIEMSKEALGYRILSTAIDKEPIELRTAGMDPESWDRAHEILERRYSNATLDICEDAALTSQKAASIAHKVKATEGLDLIIVDYLQRFGDVMAKGENRNQFLGRVSRTFAILARQLNCVVILVSQLNRTSESASDNIPKISSLRDSGELEGDSDIILLLYRPNYYDHDANQKGPQKAQIIVAKARNGRTGPVHVMWIPEKVEFIDIEGRYEN